MEAKSGMKDTIEASLYLPGGTITVMRKPQVDPSLVQLLCEVLVCFLDQFLIGASESEVIAWSSRKNAKAIPVRTAVNKCTLCTFETKSKVALNRHYKIVHTKEVAKANPNILQCDECKNTFKSKDTFKDHVSRYHGKDENIEMLEKKNY